MKIENLKVMRGPNKWSADRKKLVVVKLNLGDVEHFPTNTIDGFAGRLENLMPSLFLYGSTHGAEGLFFEQVKKGVSMSYVIEHLIVEMLTLAGIACHYSHIYPSAQKGIYTIVFSYETEKAALHAAKAAVLYAAALITGLPYENELFDDIEQLKALHASETFGPSTQSIIDEAISRNIPITRLNDESLVMLGHGVNQKIIRASMAGTTSSIAVDIVADKERTKKILSAAKIPVPNGVLLSDPEELEYAIERVGFPLVIKPVDGNHGRGITTNVKSFAAAKTAFELAKNVSAHIIAERFVQGWDYRFLLINYKLVAVAKRTPAMVSGNGKSTVAQLIDEVNSNPDRGEGHEKILTKIIVNEVTEKILADKGYTLDTVLPFAEILYLKDTANISTGGTATDLTHLVHPDNVFMAERIARLVNLDICGIDIIAQDINVPITEKNGAVIEVNAAPGFRMHITPSKGIGRNIGGMVIDMLYPENKPSRIPIVAITGTNGKTTTSRLIAHLAKKAGHKVGLTTTDGIYIDQQMICKGDCSGPGSAGIILREPDVDFAVLECARGGILRSGLGFDQCDISVVTNITEDHLGIDGIDTIEDLFNVKIVVPRTTVKDGYAILNADDNLVCSMKESLNCNIALFSVDGSNPEIVRHCANGGLAAFIEHEYLFISKGKWKTRLIKVAEIPLTFNGTAEFMIKNILPAVLTAVIRNFELKLIAESLASFIPSATTTPGRMNVFHFRKVEVIVDYAHNEGGYVELKKYIDKHPASYKIGIVAATGDRRDDDIRKIGFYAAQMFDEIVIRDDKNARGRSSEEMSRLISEGARAIHEDKIIHIIPDEIEALTLTIQCAPAGALILACADNVHNTIEFVSSLQKEELFPVLKGLVPVKQAS